MKFSLLLLLVPTFVMANSFNSTMRTTTRNTLMTAGAVYMMNQNNRTGSYSSSSYKGADYSIGSKSVVFKYSSDFRDLGLRMALDKITFKNGDLKEADFDEKDFCKNVDKAKNVLAGFIENPDINQFKSDFRSLFAKVNAEITYYNGICTDNKVNIPSETTTFQSIQGFWSSVPLNERKAIVELEKFDERFDEFSDYFSDIVREDMNGEGTSLYSRVYDLKKAQFEEFEDIMTKGSIEEKTDALFVSSNLNIDYDSCHVKIEIKTSDSENVSIGITDYENPEDRKYSYHYLIKDGYNTEESILEVTTKLENLMSNRLCY